MKLAKLLVCIMLLSAMALGGCARAARDTTGFALKQSTVVNAPFMEAWQATKAVLRDMEFDIYTRDKRGVFVAYTAVKRSLFVPQRYQYTITLEEQGATTAIEAEAVKQVYGVTLLTYPGWHDRKTTESADIEAILKALEERFNT